MKEEKFYILKNEYDTLTMLPHEKINDVYAHIHVLVEKINSLELGTIKDAIVIRKLLRVLPTNIYGSIVTYFLQVDITEVKIDHVVCKINANEGYHLGLLVVASLARNLALQANDDVKKKKKMDIAELMRQVMKRMTSHLS